MYKGKGLLKRMQVSLLGLLLVSALVPTQALAGTYERTFYITPVCSPTIQNINDIKTRLGTGGYYVKTGFFASCYYMSETQGSSQGFAFDPTALNRLLQLALDNNFPVVIGLNGGPWGGTVARDPSINAIVALEQNPTNCQYKEDNTLPPDDAGGGTVPGLNRILTYNKYDYNTNIKPIKEANFKAAVQVIANFYQQHPDLMIGINVDVEVFMNPYYIADYNPNTIKEFADYEQAKFGNDLSAFKQAMGLPNLNRWEDLQPPRPYQGDPWKGNPLAEEWTNFRIHLVDRSVQEQVNWARQVGIPAGRVFSHQTVNTENDWWRYGLCSPIETAAVNNGSMGLTTLQDNCFNENLFSAARNMSSNWGIFEYNPNVAVGGSYSRSFNAMNVAYKYGAHIIAPYYWPTENNEPQYSIKDTQFEDALRDFIGVYNMGMTNPTSLWYMPEGYTGSGFNEYICLMNPSTTTSAHVGVKFMKADGSVVHRQMNLQPNSRATIDVNYEAGSASVATHISSEQQVIAERSMYFNFGGKEGGHNSIGSTSPSTTWYLAEGYTGGSFDEYVLIQNPNQVAANATVTFMLPGGATKVANYKINPNGRFTIHVDEIVPDSSVSTKIQSDQPVVAERSMYFDNQGKKDGHDSIGVTAPSNDWYLAEGYTGGDFDTWVLIQNPNPAPTNVNVTFMLPDGSTKLYSRTLPANSRHTIHVDEILPDASVSTTIHSTDQPVIAERAMYFNYQGRDGGHDSIGVTSPANTWYLAEGYTGSGFDEYVLIQNPGPNWANPTVTFLLPNGSTKSQSYSLPPNSRHTIHVDQIVPDSSVSTKIYSDGQPVIAERAMYFDYNGNRGGHASIGYSP